MPHALCSLHNFHHFSGVNEKRHGKKKSVGKFIVRFECAAIGPRENAGRSIFN